jgi:hypothetical protein
LWLVSFDKRRHPAITSEREAVFVIRTSDEWDDKRFYRSQELAWKSVMNSLVADKSFGQKTWHEKTWHEKLLNGRKKYSILTSSTSVARSRFCFAWPLQPFVISFLPLLRI